MLKNGVDRLVRDRVKSFGDIEEEHGVLLVPVQCLVKQLVEVFEIFFNIPSRPEATLVPVDEAVE
jgi:hypothetical protein